jgi:syntaxin-binding protein 5
MVSHHYDLTVWFSDMSPQLLTSSSPLRFEYPQPLPHLTIDIGSILREPTLGSIFSRALGVITIQSLHLAADSLECLIVLNVGVVLVFCFVEEGGKRGPGIFGDISLDLDGPQNIVVPLSDLGQGLHDAFQPVCLIDARRGRITRLATSDVGKSQG